MLNSHNILLVFTVFSFFVCPEKKYHERQKYIANRKTLGNQKYFRNHLSFVEQSKNNSARTVRSSTDFSDLRIERFLYLLQIISDFFCSLPASTAFWRRQNFTCNINSNAVRKYFEFILFFLFSWLRRLKVPQSSKAKIQSIIFTKWGIIIVS